MTPTQTALADVLAKIDAAYSESGGPTDRLDAAYAALDFLREYGEGIEADARERAALLAALRECRPFVAYAFDRGIVGAEDAGRNLDAALNSAEMSP